MIFGVWYFFLDLKIGIIMTIASGLITLLPVANSFDSVILHSILGPFVISEMHLHKTFCMHCINQRNRVLLMVIQSGLSGASVSSELASQHTGSLVSLRWLGINVSVKLRF